MKILVVDDMAGMRRFVSSQLKELNYTEIDFAVNGKDAIDKIKVEKYDLILSDINMPEYDGKYLLEELAKMEHDSKVIMITAEEDVKTVAKVIELGIDEFLNKPFDSQMLKEKIDNVFSKELSTFFDIDHFIDNMNHFFCEIIGKQSNSLVKLVTSKKTREENPIDISNEITFFSVSNITDSKNKVTVTLCFKEKDYYRYLSGMFKETITDLEDDFKDIVSEYLNIVVGKQKAYIVNEKKLDCDTTIPSSFSGENYKWINDGDVDVHFNEFKSEHGSFFVLYQWEGEGIIPWMK